jgi:predicted amidophosphoribosyltransferase
MQYTECSHCGTQHNSQGRAHSCQSCGGPLRFEEEPTAVWHVTVNNFDHVSAEAVQQDKKRQEEDIARVIASLIVLLLFVYAIFLY